MTETTAFAFRSTSGEIDVDSVSESVDRLKEKMLSELMGWRYEHPALYSRETAWKRVLETGTIVQVTVAVKE